MSLERREEESPDQSPQGATPQTRAGNVPPTRETRGAGPSTALFLKRLEQVGRTALDEAVRGWRDALTSERSEWFSAENALADAVRASGMHAEQERALEQLLALFRRAGWFRSPHFGTASGDQPATKSNGSEASAQYIATIGLLALLMRGRLSAPVFDVLYKPFARAIPPDELERD